MPKGHILLTPCSGGISSALTRWYLKNTDLPIIATSRKSEDSVLKMFKNVQGLEKLKIISMDMNNDKSMQKAEQSTREILSNDGYIRLAIVSPGILNVTEKSTSQISRRETLKTFKANTIAPLMAVKHFASFLPTHRANSPVISSQHLEKATNLSDSAIFAIITAKMGSIEENTLGGWYAYRASKAAANQIVKTLNNHLAYQQKSDGQKSIAVALHPGTVKTNLSKEFWSSEIRNLREPENSAENLGKLLAKLTVNDGGKLWSVDNKIIPW